MVNGFSPVVISADISAVVDIVRSNITCSDLTILKLNSSRSHAHRIYSSIPGFPKSGIKTLPSKNWKSKVVINKQPMLTSGIIQLRAVFPDYQQILEGGYFAVLNLPVILVGRCIGTVNCLFEVDADTLPPENVIRNAMNTINSSDFPNVLDRIGVKNN